MSYGVGSPYKVILLLILQPNIQTQYERWTNKRGRDGKGEFLDPEDLLGFTCFSLTGGGIGS